MEKNLLLLVDPKKRTPLGDGGEATQAAGAG